MPFAGYKDFAACVAANQDKDDPAAYCAAIEQRTDKADMEKHGDHNYSATHGRYERKLPLVVPAFVSTRPSPGNANNAVEFVIRDSKDKPRYWKAAFTEMLPDTVGSHAVDGVTFDEAWNPDATPFLDLIIDGTTRHLTRAAGLSCTLLGVGNMGQSKYAPSGLLIQYKGQALVFDGGQDSPAIPTEVDAWFCTDPQHEFITEIKSLATGRGTILQTGWDSGYHRDELSVSGCGVPYLHENTQAYTVTIHGADHYDRLQVVWAPRGSEIDSYVLRDVDLAFIGAAGWEFPLTGPAGLPMQPSALDASARARAAGVKQMVLVNFNDDVIRAQANGQELPFGTIGEDGDRFTPKMTAAPTAQNIESGAVAYSKAADDDAGEYGLHHFSKAAEKQYTFGVMYKASNKGDDPEFDAHGEFVPAEVMQGAQWEYVRAGDRHLYLQHGVAGIIQVGEWVDLVTWPFEVEAEFSTPSGMGKAVRKSTIPANSVWMGVLWNDDGWKLVKAGKLRGFSMGGWAKRKPGIHGL
jgi:hypothetical protein